MSRLILGGLMTESGGSVGNVIARMSARELPGQDQGEGQRGVRAR
jgi:hypothetical protein